jgi:hypothetical protein
MGPVEFMQKTFTYDEHLKAKLEELEAQGWQLMQDMPPTIHYVMFRQPQAQPVMANQGWGSLTIDDSKIEIIKGG